MAFATTQELDLLERNTEVQALYDAAEGVPAAADLAGGVDLLGAVFAGLVPGAIGVGDRAALDFHDAHACIGHEDDQVDLDIAVGVVVQAQTGDEGVVFTEVGRAPTPPPPR